MRAKNTSLSQIIISLCLKHDEIRKKESGSSDLQKLSDEQQRDADDNSKYGLKGKRLKGIRGDSDRVDSNRRSYPK